MARYPVAIWSALPGIGPYSEGRFKVIHHTTQGSTAAGAIATYRQTGNYPHFKTGLKLLIVVEAISD